MFQIILWNKLQSFVVIKKALRKNTKTLYIENKLTKSFTSFCKRKIWWDFDIRKPLQNYISISNELIKYVQNLLTYTRKRLFSSILFFYSREFTKILETKWLCFAVFLCLVICRQFFNIERVIDKVSTSQAYILWDQNQINCSPWRNYLKGHTFDVFVQCKGWPWYFSSLSRTHSLLCLMRTSTHPLQLFLSAKWMAYIWPHNIRLLAPLSSRSCKTFCCDKRMAIWIGDSLYLLRTSRLSLNWSPAKRRYPIFQKCK